MLHRGHNISTGSARSVSLSRNATQTRRVPKARHSLTAFVLQRRHGGWLGLFGGPAGKRHRPAENTRQSTAAPKPRQGSHQDVLRVRQRSVDVAFVHMPMARVFRCAPDNRRQKCGSCCYQSTTPALALPLHELPCYGAGTQPVPLLQPLLHIVRSQLVALSIISRAV